MGTHPIFESDFDCLTDRSSATTTLRPNIAIVRDSGTSQTIVNNGIVNNGSKVPISRNIVKSMDHVESRIVCDDTSNSSRIVTKPSRPTTLVILSPESCRKYRT